MLTTGAIQAAYGTMYDRKIAALAAVLTENIQDDARLDLGTLIVAALADLEAVHVRVLDAVAVAHSRLVRMAKTSCPESHFSLNLKNSFPIWPQVSCR